MFEYLNKIKALALENLKNDLPDHTILDESTYIHTHKKAKFIDKEYGEFWAFPLNVMRGHFHKKRGIEQARVSKLQSTLKKYNLPDGIDLDITTFKGLNKKARFIDNVHGEWWTTARHVLERGCGHPKNRGKRIRETMEKRYGVSYNMQDPVIFSKSMKSQLKSKIVKHWKTGEDLDCVASYEFFVVNLLNSDKIDFEWQSKVFTMPDGKTYRPDLYLVKEDKWIEIKGHFWKDAKSKWDWFQSIMPNSELWDQNKLKEMGYKYRRKYGNKRKI